MSSTLTCPSCGSETPSRHNFCTICNQQTKCLNETCNAELVPGKDFCFSCSQTITKKLISQTQLNKYTRTVKQVGKSYEEHTELIASDCAVSELAPFIAGQMTHIQGQKHLHSPNGSTIRPQKVTVVNSPLVVEQTPQLPASNNESQQNQLSQIGASRYFECDGDLLIATVKDFKGKSWADQQRRFILLYTEAHYKLFGKPVPSKDHFRSAAEKASVLEPTNFTKYLTELSRKHLSEISGGYKLNHDGEKEVKNIIAFIEDENVEPGYKYWERSINSGTKRFRLSKDDKLKLQEWAQEEVELGNLKVRDIRKPQDYALIALWIITVHLNKAEAVRWNDAYYYFQEKFKTISASQASFNRSMANPTNEKYFRKNGELFFLTSEGQKKVEDWIAGKPFDGSSDADVDVDN